MKAYRNSKGYRNIPVGYSAADIAELRPMLQDFLTCGGNDSDTIDFFSLNSYEWCGEVDYQTSGYSNLEAGAANFPVPIFFSETGCNTVRPRTFEDQAAIFGKEMINDWVCLPCPPPPQNFLHGILKKGRMNRDGEKFGVADSTETPFGLTGV